VSGPHVHLLDQFHDVSLFDVSGTNRVLGIAYDEGEAVSRQIFVKVIHVDATVQIDVAVDNLRLEEQRNARRCLECRENGDSAREEHRTLGREVGSPNVELLRRIGNHLASQINAVFGESGNQRLLHAVHWQETALGREVQDRLDLHLGKKHVEVHGLFHHGLNLLETQSKG